MDGGFTLVVRMLPVMVPGMATAGSMGTYRCLPSLRMPNFSLRSLLIFFLRSFLSCSSFCCSTSLATLRTLCGQRTPGYTHTHTRTTHTHTCHSAEMGNA